MKLASSVTKGLFFDCQQCGQCCSSSIEGYIYVFKSDVERLAKHFKLSLEDFADKYLEIVEYNFRIWDEQLEYNGKKRSMPTLVLRNEKGHDCLFLKRQNDKKLCTIYDARPFQCEAYPRWTMLMENETTLRETAVSCPGFILNFEEGQSKQLKKPTIHFFSPEEIDQLTQKERQIERDYYLAMKSNNFDIFQVYTFLKRREFNQIQSEVLPNRA